MSTFVINGNGRIGHVRRKYRIYFKTGRKYLNITFVPIFGKDMMDLPAPPYTLCWFDSTTLKILK